MNNTIPTSPLCPSVVDAIIFAPIFARPQRRGQVIRGITLKTLLLVLHRHEGVILPLEWVAELSGVSSDSVTEGLKALRGMGLLDRERVSRKGSGPGSFPFKYRINRDRLFELAKRGRKAVAV